MAEQLSTAPLTGTRDFFPEEMSVRMQVFEKLYRVVEGFGYLRYDGPMLEPIELYTAKSSEEIVAKQTYLLNDRSDPPRRLVVRPEMTPTVARMIAAKAGGLSLPARWYSHPNLWRYEKKQRGRYREHWQVNVDVFGTESFEAEAEIFELCAEMMFALGAKTEDFLLRVSDRALMHALLTGFGGVADEKVPAVYGVLDQLAKLPEEETRKRLVELGTDADKVLRIVGSAAEALFAMAPPEALARSNMARVMREGLATSKPVNLKFDPQIIRGFTYYTSTVFEIYDVDPANPRSIAGGGRYDNLVGIFGKARVPGLGFGMGDVTLIDFLETHGIAPAPRLAAEAQVMSPTMNTPADRMRVKQLAAELRSAGLRVTTALEPRKLGKQLEKAVKEGVRFAVIAGEEEAARGTVKLKDLAKSEEREVERGAIAATVRAAIADARQT